MIKYYACKKLLHGQIKYEEKLNIPSERFFKKVNWIKEKSLAPKGKSKKVSARKYLLITILGYRGENMGWIPERRGICNDLYAEYNDRQNIKRGEKEVIATFGEIAIAFSTKPEIIMKALANRGVEISNLSDGLICQDIIFIVFTFESRAKIEILREAQWFKKVCSRSNNIYQIYRTRLGINFKIDYKMAYVKKFL